MRHRWMMIVLVLICLGVVSSTALGYDDIWEQIHTEVWDGRDFDFQGATLPIIRYGTIEEAIGYAPWLIQPGLVEEALELFNVGEFVWIDGRGSNVEINLARLLAGESTHDIWTLGPANVWTYVSQGAIYPICDIVPDRYWELLPGIDRTSAEVLSYEGKKYMFGSPNQGPLHRAMWISLYNKDMLAREGASDPYELWQEDLWTWEAVTEIAQRITRDTTGDGEVDQWGMYRPGVIQMALANNGYPVKTEPDGRFVFAFDQEPALEALQQVHQWIQIDQVAKPTGWADRPLVEGDVGLSLTSGGNHLDKIIEMMEEDYGLVPLPKGPSSVEYVYPARSVGGRALPINSEQPEAMIAVYDFLYRWDNYSDREEFGAELAPNRESARVLYDCWDRFDSTISYVHGSIIGSIFPEAINAVIAGERSAAGAMNEVKPAAQGALDEFFR